MQNCRAGASAANENQAGPLSNPHLDQLAADSEATVSCDYLLANRSVVGQNPVGRETLLTSSQNHYCGGREKVAGRVGQVTDNIVYLSHLTGAEFYDAFVDVKDISAVVIRAAAR
jgi:hypothetical protein